MQKAMTVYVKSLSERAQGTDREKMLPGGHLGSSMVTHSEDFEPDSEFGNCLSCTYTTPHSHPTHANHRQPSDEQTSVWRECRKPTSKVPLLPGWKVWTAPWPR